MDTQLHVLILAMVLIVLICAGRAEVRTCVVVGNHSLAPVASLAGWLGARVEYNESDRHVTFRQDELTITLAPNSREILQNGVRDEMPMTPILYHDRLYAPVRFLAGTLGLQVEWDSARHCVVLNKPSTDEQLLLMVQPFETGNGPMKPRGIAITSKKPASRQESSLAPLRSLHKK